MAAAPTASAPIIKPMTRFRERQTRPIVHRNSDKAPPRDLVKITVSAASGTMPQRPLRSVSLRSLVASPTRSGTDIAMASAKSLLSSSMPPGPRMMYMLPPFAMPATPFFRP